MTGTVIITGANGSLGLGYVEQLLKTYPSFTLIAAVRNPSPQTDANTAKLQHLISRHENVRASIEPVDLGSLSSVRSFADSVANRVAEGNIPPIAAIVCNAFAWSLDEGQKFSSDDYELGFQVTHLSHFLLVVKLLGSMDMVSGRVVMVGSAVHDPAYRFAISKLGAELPAERDLEELVKPKSDAIGQMHDRGFQRYATSKLANVIFMHDLNRRLEKDPDLRNITALAMDPGGLPSSRAHAAGKASTKLFMSTMNLLLPVLKHVTDQVRSTASSGRDLVEVSVGPEFQNHRGYYNGRSPLQSAPITMEVEKQKMLWASCWKWAGLQEQETMLKDVS